MNIMDNDFAIKLMAKKLKTITDAKIEIKSMSSGAEENLFLKLYDGNYERRAHRSDALTAYLHYDETSSEWTIGLIQEDTGEVLKSIKAKTIAAVIEILKTYKGMIINAGLREAIENMPSVWWAAEKLSSKNQNVKVKGTFTGSLGYGDLDGEYLTIMDGRVHVLRTKRDRNGQYQMISLEIRNDDSEYLSLVKEGSTWVVKSSYKRKT